MKTELHLRWHRPGGSSRSRALAFWTLLALSSLKPQLTIVLAQGTAFTYQGRLHDAGGLASGSYDLRFRLFDAATNGVQIGNVSSNAAVDVSNGLFTTTLDFGPSAFPGSDRWLQLAVRTNGGFLFVLVSPRQKITATPYAITAGNLTSAGLSGTYSNAVTLNNPANSFTGNGTDLTNVNAATLGGLGATNFWQISGNGGTTPGPQFLGTTDNQALELKANSQRALRLEPGPTSGVNAGGVNVIGGFSGNVVSNGFSGAVIAGGGQAGYPNRVGANYAAVLGGIGNTASGSWAAAVGRFSTASGYTAMAMGDRVAATGSYATAIGCSTIASGTCATAMGLGTVAGGAYSMAMGAGSQATNDFSFAAGRNALASHPGALVWADSTGAALASAAADSVTMRAAGGYRLFSDRAATAGVSLAGGGTSWATISDRKAKKDFAPVNSLEILEKLAAMPITQWHYKWEDEHCTAHIGPMAQDFKAAFYPGSDDKTISTQEAEGVAFAAIQGLNEKVESAKQKAEIRINNLEQRLEQKETELEELKRIVKELKAAFQQGPGAAFQQRPSP